MNTDQDATQASRNHICPVCGYDGLETAPYSETGGVSYEICPSCGVEFGVDDYEQSHVFLRQKWLESGAQWWSSYYSPPPGWDAYEQLKGAGLDASEALEDLKGESWQDWLFRRMKGAEARRRKLRSRV